MPALFKSIGRERRTKGVASSEFGNPDRNRNSHIRVVEIPRAEDTHDLSFRSAALIGQARQQRAILYMSL